MESTQAQVLTEKELEKREKKRTYMREYKQRKYLEDRDKENQFHRSYLIKKKLGLDDELFKKYGKELAIVIKIKQLVTNLKVKNLVAFNEVWNEMKIE